MLAFAPYTRPMRPPFRLGQARPLPPPPPGYQQIFPKINRDLMVGDFEAREGQLILLTDRTERRFEGKSVWESDPSRVGTEYVTPGRSPEGYPQDTLDSPVSPTDWGWVYYRAISKKRAVEEVRKAGGNVDMVWETEIRKPSPLPWVVGGLAIAGIVTYLVWPK